MKGMRPENRPATAKERSLVEWLLRHGKPGAEQFLKQLESLVVVSKCSCGCPTVFFAQEGEAVAQGAEHILADYLAAVNGEDIGVILFQREGRLSHWKFTRKQALTSHLAFPRWTRSIRMKSFLNDRRSAIVSRVELSRDQRGRLARPTPRAGVGGPNLGIPRLCTAERGSSYGRDSNLSFNFIANFL